jgi:hypothetical protein
MTDTTAEETTQGKPKVVYRDAFKTDTPGNAPKQFASHFEQKVFEAIRARADRAVQCLGAPLTYPQMDQDPLDYRLSIVSELCAGTNLRGADVLLRQAANVGDLERIVFDAALKTPEAQGRLAEIKSIDRTGRVTSEFVGAKKQWLKPFLANPQIGAFCDERGKFQRTPIVM